MNLFSTSRYRLASETKELGVLEGVAADDAGNIYGGYTNTLNFTKGGPSEVNLRRWVKKAPGL